MNCNMNCSFRTVCGTVDRTPPRNTCRSRYRSAYNEAHKPGVEPGSAGPHAGTGVVATPATATACTVASGHARTIAKNCLEQTAAAVDDQQPPHQTKQYESFHDFSPTVEVP